MPESHTSENLPLQRALPVGGAGPASTGWWGLWTLVLTEASLFGYLLLCYFYLLVQTHPAWPPEGAPKLLLSGINTCLLLSSSGFVWLAERDLKAGRKVRSLTWLTVTILLGAAFVAVQLKEWSGKAYGITSNLYGSLFFTITGFHMLHVIVGLIILTLLWWWIASGRVTASRPMPLSIGGLYWHFVDSVWLIVFASLYLVPYIQGR